MSEREKTIALINNAIKPLHKRLLTAQKNIQQLKDVAYADHRLIAKMDSAISAQNVTIRKLQKRIFSSETDT